MKRLSLVPAHLTTLAALTAVALVACSDGTADHLNAGGSYATDPDSLAGGPNGTFHHAAQSTGDDNGYTDPQLKKAADDSVGGAEVVARLHATQKIPYASLGRMLADLGVNLGNQNAGSAGALYKAGGSALGVPNYANRVPEMLIPSTSSLAKEFDIFTAAAPEILANIGNSSRCPGVVLVANNQFTEDGITCLLGKAARPEHVTLANQLVTESTTPQIGLEIAVATLLSAAHTSE